MDSQQPVALVTGCSEGGIGYAITLELARRGFHVAASSRSLSSMASLGTNAHLPNVHVLSLDVSSPDSVADGVASVIAAYGRIDVLVNNAGVPCVGPVAELPLSTLERTLRTNVIGPVSVIQAVIPHMVQARKGTIVNVGSVAGFASVPWSGGYCASKFALHALTDSLRLELKPFGVQVVLVAPGLIASNFGKNAATMFKDIKLNIYKPYETAMESRIKSIQKAMATPAALFAKEAMDAVLQENPPRCYIYGSGMAIYVLLYYLPLWVRDWYLSRRCGLWPGTK